MTKYEYTIALINDTTGSAIKMLEELRQMGDQGWCAVCQVPSPGKNLAFLMMRIAEGQPMVNMKEMPEEMKKALES